ncbi:MAG TPA: hypothetical protein VJI46_00425 [Candidatus Nanoarchaeia archaeon]|nr:hypothetical protein [Candidatus Nanoarchaeia archaeon]
MSFALCLGTVAPYYNLILVLVVGFMFLRLFSMPNKGIYLTPWKLLFAALTIYIIEELFTVLYVIDVVKIPRIMNAVFEMVMITLFIYLLLLQKDYLGRRKK